MVIGYLCEFWTNFRICFNFYRKIYSIRMVYSIYRSNSVLIAGIILVIMPIRLLLRNIKEIITMSASDDIQYAIYKIIKEMNDHYHIKEEDLRITKMGQIIYIDLQNIVDNNSDIKQLKKQINIEMN